MANNFSYINKLPRRIAEIYYKLRKEKSKLQRKAADIGFVEKAIINEVTPIFAKVRGAFTSPKDKWSAEKSIMKSNLDNHYKRAIINLRIY